MIKQRLRWFKNATVDDYKKLIQTVKDYRAGCDEIWINVLHQFQTPEKVNEYVKSIKWVIDELQILGVKVSVEIKTFGDPKNPSSNFELSGIKNFDESFFSVDIDGKRNFGQFCWRNKEHIEYKKSIIKAICSVFEPYAIYFDDDMRLTNCNRLLHCFCPSCMSEFNKQYGTNYTREQLFELYETNDEVKEMCYQFSLKGITEFCYEMGKFISKNTKSTYSGIQHGGYSGLYYSDCLEALHKSTGRKVMSRSGGAAYSDKDPNEILVKTFDTQFQLANLPDCTLDRCNEVESYPHYDFIKTVGAFCLETTLHLASGFNSTSCFFTYPTANKEIFYKGIEEFSKRKNYWTKLVDSYKGCIKGGLSIFVPKHYWMPNSKNTMIEAGLKGIQYNHLGIPLTFQHNDNSIYYLSADFAQYISEDELNFLLSKPVVTFGSVLSILQSRGFGKCFSAEAVNTDNFVTSDYYEKMSNSEVNNGFIGKEWGLSILCAPYHYFKDKNNKTIELSHYSKIAKDIVSDNDLSNNIASCFVETSLGQKWFVQGFCETDVLIPFFKKQQIDNAIDCLGKISVRVMNMARVMILPAERDDGVVTSVTICNTSIEIQENCIIRVNKPLSNNAEFRDEFNNLYKLDTKIDSDYAFITLPKLLPWTAGTVFFI